MWMPWCLIYAALVDGGPPSTTEQTCLFHSSFFVLLISFALPVSAMDPAVVELRAGKLVQEGDLVKADPRRGLLRIVQVILLTQRQMEDKRVRDCADRKVYASCARRTRA